MKNKKGFTLVEVLGVITILAVLALIAVPTVDNIITKNRQKMHESQIATIKNSLKTWGDAYAQYLPEDGEEALLIDLGLLKVMGFIDEDIKNPNTNLCFSNDMLLSIAPVKKGYTYYVDEESGLDGTETDCSAPIDTEFLFLKGNGIIDLPLDSTYVEPGFLALNVNGELGNSSVTQVIKDKNGNTVTSIDTSLSNAGPYTITYTYGTVNVTRILNIGFHIYADGTAVYFNPVTGVKCDAGSAVSTTGTKTGCMKWHVFNDSYISSTVNLILDHNTTAQVVWNPTLSNVNGPTNLLTQLQADTSSWTGVPTRNDSYSVSNGTATYTINYSTYKARLISAAEIASITGNSSFGETTTEKAAWFYLDSNSLTQTATTTGASNYDWLFDYTSGCTSYGCNIADASNIGYWTSTAVYNSSNAVWIIERDGSLGNRFPDTSSIGVRPVITISKSNL